MAIKKSWFKTLLTTYLLNENSIKRGLLFCLIITLSDFSFSQKVKNDSLSHINGAVTVTNNGISFIPTFSLGKPAVIFDLSIGKRLSFEPQFRFALEGKPWSFIFWGRYKLVNNNRFLFTVGAHPALSFRTIIIPTDVGSSEVIKASRYAAAELSPNYFLTRNISIGMYYLYGHCFENDAPRHTHFLTFNASLSGIDLPKQFFLRFNPQIYYLKIGESDGYYFSSSMGLARRNFPLSLSALINKAIRSNIVSKDFVWNVSLIYSFNNKYVRK